VFGFGMMHGPTTLYRALNEKMAGTKTLIQYLQTENRFPTFFNRRTMWEQNHAVHGLGPRLPRSGSRHECLVRRHEGLFKVIKLFLFAVFGAIRMALTSVFRAVFGSFLEELKTTEDTGYEAGHDAYDTATDVYDDGYESGTDSDDDYDSGDDCDYDSESEDEFYGHVATPATLRFLAAIYRRDRVDYRSY
jgi:hypothetical protein